MMEKINKHHRIIVACALLVMLVAGLFVTSDYGMPWDELLEIRTLGSNVREYIGLVQGEENEPIKSSTGITFPDYLKNEDMDHGQAAYYAFSPALFVDFGEGAARSLMILWHGYTFLIFMAGVVALYFICATLCGDWKYGALGSLFLYLSPRFFAEGHYNSKDIVTMSLALLCIWFGIKMIKEKKFINSVLFALSGAFATNTRISAVFLFGLFGILYIISLSVNKQWSKRHFLVGLAAVLSFLGFFYLISPAAWREPIEFISYTLKRSADFSAWPGIVYFWGTIHRPVPPLYIPVMIGVTTPLLLLLLILTGHITSVIQLIKEIKTKKFSLSTPIYILCIVYIWTFLLFAIIKQPILYNSWRHFYFLNGALLILAVGAVQFIVSRLKGKWKWISVGAVSAQLVACLVIIIVSHPFQYVYYNSLAGPDPAIGYEFDYWNVSQVNLLMKLVDENPEVMVFKISSNDWYTDDGLKKAYKILPEEYKMHIKVYPFSGGPDLDADYVMQNELPEKIMEAEKKYQQGFWIYSGNDFVPSMDCPKVASLTAQTSPFNKPVDFMVIYALGESEESMSAEGSMTAEASMTVEASMSGEESMTGEEFRKIMEGEAFVLTEGPSSEEISDAFGVTVNELICVTQGDSADPDAYFIYTIFGSNEDAIKYFDVMVDNMEMAIKTSGLDVAFTEENSDNYSKWTGKGDSGMGFNVCQSVIRLENTILQVVKKYNLESDIEPIDAIVSKLGY